MLVVDFLILNRDRHGANIEVLSNRSKKTIRLAPLFDHGLSLVFSTTNFEQLNKVDLLSDQRVQCCVGSNSTFENLNLIPRDKLPKLNPLTENDELVLMDGLEEVLPEEWRKKIWNMIWTRWQFYESFCNQR